MTASFTAQATHAAYLGRVASWLDGLPLDGLDEAARLGWLDLRQVAFLVDRIKVDPRALLFDGDGSGWPLFCARVERVGRLFRFATEDGEGFPALLIVARDAAGQGVELVAWSAREGWTASETGALALLGAEWLCPLADDPVDVHADVLGWLRAGRRGVVMMDRRRAVPVLREASGLIVSDLAFGNSLERLLTIKPPKIGLREAA